MSPREPRPIWDYFIPDTQPVRIANDNTKPLDIRSAMLPHCVKGAEILRELDQTARTLED